MIGPAPICMECRRLRSDAKACAAFPGGIPETIWLHGGDHRRPFSGDHGIRFALKSGKEELFRLWTLRSRRRPQRGVKHRPRPEKCKGGPSTRDFFGGTE